MLAVVLAVLVVATVGAFVLVRRSSGSTRSSTPESVATTTPVPPSTLPSKAVSIAAGPVAPVFSKVPTTDPVVFFTIDDGLVRDEAVVKFLRKHKIPVTLFLPIDPVRAGEPFFEEIRALGATVQNHTVHHQVMTKLMPFGQHTEICKAADELALRFGRRPWMFRPPEGKYNADTTFEARACGIRAIVLWTGATNDGRLDLQHPGRLQAGDIILMHFRTDLLQNLRVALNAAEAAGLTPGRLDEYLTPA